MSFKGKTWDVGGIINIAFLDGTPDQKEKVKRWAGQWLLYANLHFNWDSSVRDSDIRISFKHRGSWSYIGTDAMFIEKTRATMNFAWLDEAVVLHEFGHALGRMHEHQHPDKPYNYDIENVLRILSGKPNYWDRSQIYRNVLDVPKNDNLIKDAYDGTSIMQYFFPPEFTVERIGMTQNKKLSDADKAHALKVYPFPMPTTPDRLLLAMRKIYATHRIKKLNLSDHREVLKTLGYEGRLPRRENELIESVRNKLANLKKEL